MYKFGDVATFKYGKMPNKSKISDDGKYPVFSGYRYVGRYNEYNMMPEQLVVVARGVGGTGDVKITTEKCFLTNLSIGVDIVRNDLVNAKYLYYYFTLNNLRYLDSGSAQSQITITDLEKVNIPLPDLGTQNKIAFVLNMLDSKIEQNIAINNNLEQQIQIIFNQTFVNASFENQGTTTLGTVCECVLGGTPSRTKAEFWNGDIPWINSGEVNKFRITKPSEYITKLGLDKSATKLLPAHTTVIAITGATLGQISLLEIDSCTNQSVVGILENDNVPFEFIYPFICQNIGVLLSHQTGGAQQHINKQNVEQLPLVLPIKSVLLGYKNKVEPFFKMIAKNCFENERLAAIRDALLPKLMSGEIDVSQVDISDPGCLDKSLFNCVEG